MSARSGLRIAIVDDEPLARARLQRLLKTRGDIAALSDCSSALALISKMRSERFDVVLLDIQMPELDGFELLARLPEPRPWVIFVSAYTEFALQAFGIDAIDYLVKPVNAERLEQALAKVHRLRQTEPARVLPESYLKRILIRQGQRMEWIEVDSIDRILAQANYIEIFAGSRQYALRRPMSWLEARLDPTLFARVHRSAVVRKQSVIEVRALGSGRYALKLHSGASVETGRSYAGQIQQWLNEERLPKGMPDNS